MLTRAASNRRELQIVSPAATAKTQAVAQQVQASGPGCKRRRRIQSGRVARGDRPRVTSGQQNLLDNAGKYSSKVSEPCIGLGAEALSATVVVFDVRDNGIGFDKAKAARLFPPFERLPSSWGDAGSGLVLPSVQRLVARRGGSVRAQCMPGTGTVFSFTLETPAAAH